MVDTVQSPTRNGEPGPSRGHWRESQTPPLLKSAVQKAIRRGDLGVLRWSLDRVWRRPEGRAWLCRRLPILAGEELWSHVGWAGYTGRIGQALVKRPGAEQAARVVLEGAAAALAAAVKNKDAEGLQTLARWGEDLPASVGALTAALQAGQALRVAVITFALLGQGGDPWTVLLGWAATHGTTESVLVVEEARARYGRGALEDDQRLFVGAAVLAALYPEQVATHIELHPVEAFAVPPDWVVADMHTDLGRRALSRVAKARNIPRETLSTLWFYMESARLDRERTDGWWPTAVETILQRHGFASVGDARQTWEWLRSEIQHEIEAGLPTALLEVEQWVGS